MDSILIEPNCLATIVSSALEVYNRETNGYLLSRKKRAIKNIHGRKHRLLNLNVAYPFQTSDRKPTEVDHGNLSATHRVIDSLNSMGVKLIGGYHSHPYPNHDVIISDDDVKAALEEIERVNCNGVTLKRWLELIISAKRLDYETPHKLGYTFKSSGDGIRVKVNARPYLGFDLKIAGYWIYPKGDSALKRRALVYARQENRYF